jgi:hypothetical protein
MPRINLVRIAVLHPKMPRKLVLAVEREVLVPEEDDSSLHQSI